MSTQKAFTSVDENCRSLLKKERAELQGGDGLLLASAFNSQISHLRKVTKSTVLLTYFIVVGDTWVDMGVKALPNKAWVDVGLEALLCVFRLGDT